MHKFFSASLLSHRLFPHMVLIFTMLTWSSSFVAFKVALSEFSPLEVVAGRMIIASFVCLPFFKRILPILKNKKTRFYLLLGVFSEPCLYFLCESFALQYTSSSQAGMVISLLPLCVGFFAWIFLREQLPVLSWIGFLLGVIGVMLLSSFGEVTQSAPNPLLGNFLEFCAVLCAVSYTICVRKLVHVMSPLAYTVAMAYAGAIFFTPLALLPINVSPVTLDVTIPLWLPLACIIYLALVVNLLAYGGYTYALSRLPAGQVASFTNLIPIFTLIMGVLWLDESLNSMQLFASILILSGVILSQCAGKVKIIKKKNTIQ